MDASWISVPHFGGVAVHNPDSTLSFKAGSVPFCLFRCTSPILDLPETYFELTLESWSLHEPLIIVGLIPSGRSLRKELTPLNSLSFQKGHRRLGDVFGCGVNANGDIFFRLNNDLFGSFKNRVVPGFPALYPVISFGDTFEAKVSFNMSAPNILPRGLYRRGPKEFTNEPLWMIIEQPLGNVDYSTAFNQESFLFTLPTEIVSCVLVGHENFRGLLAVCKILHKLLSPHYRWIDFHDLRANCLGNFATTECSSLALREDGTYEIQKPDFSSEKGFWSLLRDAFGPIVLLASSTGVSCWAGYRRSVPVFKLETMVEIRHLGPCWELLKRQADKTFDGIN